MVKKFKVKNGFPTMSAILTTHSIAQAKHIYRILKEMKDNGTLLNGRQFDERHQLIDKDFPRVAITFSTNPDQLEKNEQDDELVEIMKEYAKQFDASPYQDEKLYNQNINKRLARKEKQYQSDGQWLDFVIVVDRLLTGFDSPTIQTLYVDREMNYQKLLQAFSRTNRIYTGKDSGLIVSFRKPFTMRENVRNTFRLFSNEKQNFDQLIPKEYEEVKKEFIECLILYKQSEADLSDNPNDLKTMIAQVSAYQKLEKSYKALRSYDQYEEDFEEFSEVVEQLPQYQGKTENIKTKIKEMIEDEEHPEEDFEKLLQEIAFSSQLNATHKDVVDSFYINQLLKAIQLNEAGAVEKFEKEIQQKDPQIQKMYHTLKDQLVNTTEEIDVAQLKETSIQNEIQRQLQKEAEEFGLSFDILQSAMNEYQSDKKTIPYLTHLLDSMTLSKEEFEAKTGEKYRRRTKVLEERLQQNFEQLQKWKEEL